MIGLDTNVLVRYLAQDDPVQSRKATALLERNLTVEEPGFVSAVVLVETTWVLERIYGLTHFQITTVIERILQAETLVIEHEAEVATAQFAVRSGNGSFADALISAINLSAGCSRTTTFDRKALRLPGFELL